MLFRSTDAQPSCTSRRPLAFFLTSDSFEFMMFESESPASDLDLQSFKSWNAGDVLSELLSSESWALGLQINKSLMMMTLIRAFTSSGSSELDQIQSSFLLSSSELQVLGNWSLGFFGTWFFRSSIPWKLETFTQNFWFSVFFGA